MIVLDKENPSFKIAVKKKKSSEVSPDKNVIKHFTK